MDSNPELNPANPLHEESAPGDEGDASLADDIFGIAEYIPETPKKKDFQPWHKPRKQYVRESQWCEEILKMVDEILPENNVLKYLGLPGDDLFDIRFFHEQICVQKNLKIKFLGFNTSVTATSDNKAEFNISLDEVTKLPYVDPGSEVIGDDITDIASRDSFAWDKFRKMGPVDVINIDLCDGFGKHPPDKFVKTHYNTLAQFLSLQARRQNPWLLLLTTRTGIDHIDANVLTILKALYNNNLTKCSNFQNSSAAKFSINNANDIDEACKTGKGVSDIFIISLCKWVAQLLVQQDPSSKMEVRSVIGYKVYPTASHQDLVSVAIKIIPTASITNDPLGLVQPTPLDNKENPDECSMAVQALKSVAQQVDADVMLDDDPALKKRMITEFSDLLDSARYDISKYLDWLG